LAAQLVRPPCKVPQSLNRLRNVEILGIGEKDTSIKSFKCSQVVCISFNQIGEFLEELPSSRG
jgi:hypothetical protein